MQTQIKIVMKPVNGIKFYENNPRNHDETVSAVIQSIHDYGFVKPILIDKDGVIVDGEACVKAAKAVGLKELPCIVTDELTNDEVRALRLVINKTQDLTSWTFDKLAEELAAVNIDMSAYKFPDLSDIDLDVSDEDFLQKEEKDKEPAKKTTVCPNCGHKFEI